MKKIIVLSIMLMSMGYSKYIGQIYYDSDTRTVYVKPKHIYDNPIVYFAGESIFGGCVKPHKYVYTMKYTPLKNISRTVKSQLGIKDEYASGSTSGTRTERYTRDRVWSYNFNSMRVQHLHFNIKVEKKRNGRKYTSGWKPDSGGGCTYKVPLY